VLLQRAGWPVGKDRVQRIWRREGLKVPQKQKCAGRVSHFKGPEESVRRFSAKHAKCGFKAKHIVFKIKGCRASFISWIPSEVAGALSLSLL
jgi:hypothetical protein